MIEKIKLSNGDEVFIKKGWDGYRVVYPNKKDLSQPLKGENIHWKNLLIGGHWSYLLKMALFLIALYFFVQMYLSDTQTCREFVNNIEEVCTKYASTLINRTANLWTQPAPNITIKFEDYGNT